MMLTAGALKLYDAARLMSDDAIRATIASQLQRRGKPMPRPLAPKPRNDARGHPTLTQADIMAALGGLPAEPFAFGMAAFLGDMRSLRFLERRLQATIAYTAEAEGWVTRRAHRVVIAQMSELLLFEVITARSRNETYPGEKAPQANSARIRCPQCLGKGVSPRAETCALCGGDGSFLLTDRRRAEALSLKINAWYRTWAPRYAGFMQLPLEWEARAIGHVRRRLGPSADKQCHI